MPHVFDLPIAQKEALSQSNGPNIAIRVMMKATYRDVTGFVSGVPTFANTYTTSWADLSNRFEGPLRISFSKPIFPDGDPFSRSELQISLINTDGYIASLQSGAMIRLSDIEQGEVVIDAQIEGVAQPLALFRGRIIGPPMEERGRTTFTLVDAIWDALRKPVLYEDFSSVTGSQGLLVVAGLIDPPHREVNTTYGHFCAYNGLLSFDAQGGFRIRYENSDPDLRDLKGITISNGAKPGKYSIFFTNAVSFTLTYPDNSVYKGTVSSDTVTPYVTIKSTDWTIEDFKTGIIIDFWISCGTYRGNPVTIARKLIEQALLNNIGIAPGLTLQVAMDIAAWDAAEKRFQSYTIFMSETNEDNSVWQQKRGENNMPFNCLQLAQRALDHVGCFLQMRRDGLISIVTPFLDGRNVWDLRTDESITNIKVTPQDQWNFLTLQYGEERGSFTTLAQHDLRVNVAHEVNEKVVSMPYYKAGASRYRATWLLETYVRRYHRRQQLLSIDIIPQMALPLLCGDFIRVVSDAQPELSLICELISIGIDPRGICNAQLCPIQQYEGDPFALCVAHLADELLW